MGREVCAGFPCGGSSKQKPVRSAYGTNLKRETDFFRDARESRDSKTLFPLAINAFFQGYRDLYCHLYIISLY